VHFCSAPSDLERKRLLPDLVEGITAHLKNFTLRQAQGIKFFNMTMEHIPVLLSEVLKYVNPEPDQNYIDATLGLGGHTNAILEKNGPDGKILGIEADSDLYEKLAAKKNDRLTLVNDSYVNLKKIARANKFLPVHGILADLGMSSWHLDKCGRGFSFLKDEPLGMRYSAYQETKNQKPKTKNLTAAEVINLWSEEQLSDIFWQYGEEKFSRQIARKIIESRKVKPIINTFQLVEIVKAATPIWYQRQRINPATRIFQALRIAVNNELENLKIFLPQALELLEKSGRLAIISFHSLEDRIVKNFFKEKKEKGLIKILTKKVIKPTAEEIINNPRSRSAKLRVAIKL